MKKLTQEEANEVIHLILHSSEVTFWLPNSQERREEMAKAF
jgi:hypothetical protein